MGKQGDPWGPEYPERGGRENYPPGQPSQPPQYDPWADSQRQPLPPRGGPWAYQEPSPQDWRRDGGRAVPPQFQTDRPDAQHYRAPQSRPQPQFQPYQQPQHRQPGAQFTQQPPRPAQRQPERSPQPRPPRRPRHTARKVLAGIGGAAVIVIIAVNLLPDSGHGTPSAAASSSAKAPAASAAVSHAAKPKAKPSPSCTLPDTPTYIVRDDDPGASVIASDIGNADYATCTTMLSNFAADAGEAPGECTTVALASDNPGYDVNEIPAPPLKDVIEAAGPGC